VVECRHFQRLHEKTWQQSYRGAERVYDYEGEVENGYPLREGISDVNEPGSGYIWTDLARNGKSLYHFGEFISTTFCANPDMVPKGSSPPRERPNRSRRSAERAATSGTAKPFRRTTAADQPLSLANSVDQGKRAHQARAGGSL
jgi:hypothetical protein